MVVKNLLANAGNMRHGFNPCVGKISWRSMITHSSILVWRIPWTEEPAGLQSKESQRVSLCDLAEQAHTTEKMWGLL